LHFLQLVSSNHNVSGEYQHELRNGNLEAGHRDEDGRLQGVGMRVYPDGMTMHGTFQDDHLHGWGCCKKNNQTLNGQFVNGRPHGECTFIGQDGKKFLGNFLQGQPWDGILMQEDGTYVEVKYPYFWDSWNWHVGLFESSWMYEATEQERLVGEKEVKERLSNANRDLENEKKLREEQAMALMKIIAQNPPKPDAECPISLIAFADLNEQIVVASDGFYYAESKIKAWVALGKTSPLTRDKLFDFFVPAPTPVRSRSRSRSPDERGRS